VVAREPLVDLVDDVDHVVCAGRHQSVSEGTADLSRRGNRSAALV
jgi:hypothetical protein